MGLPRTLGFFPVAGRATERSTFAARLDAIGRWTIIGTGSKGRVADPCGSMVLAVQSTDTGKDTVSLPVLSASSSPGSDAVLGNPVARLPGDP